MAGKGAKLRQDLDNRMLAKRWREGASLGELRREFGFADKEQVRRRVQLGERLLSMEKSNSHPAAQ